MRLTDILTEKKATIASRWLQKLFESYPAQTALFLNREKNRFDNPVGSRLSQGLEGLLDALLKEMEVERIRFYLNEVIQVRAVQNFTPSQALAFIFLLKNIVREELAEEIRKENLAAELFDLDSCIDGLALLGFDIYTQHRERLNEVKVNEIKNRVSGLMRRTGLSLESTD